MPIERAYRTRDWYRQQYEKLKADRTKLRNLVAAQNNTCAHLHERLAFYQQQIKDLSKSAQEAMEWKRGQSTRFRIMEMIAYHLETLVKEM